MKVIVMGSGVIGVTSAWYLAEAGHEVIVVDRQPGPVWKRASRTPVRYRRDMPRPGPRPESPQKHWGGCL